LINSSTAGEFNKNLEARLRRRKARKVKSKTLAHKLERPDANTSRSIDIHRYRIGRYDGVMMFL
jgi:hypothetical protein